MRAQSVYFQKPPWSLVPKHGTVWTLGKKAQIKSFLLPFSAREMESMLIMSLDKTFFILRRSLVCPHLKAAFCNAPPFQQLLKSIGNQWLPEDDVRGGVHWAYRKAL